MIVRAVFEFDTEGLTGFDDLVDPRCRQNILDTFRRMLYNVQDNMLTELSSNPPTACSNEAIQIYKVESELIRRILTGMKVLEEVS